MCLQSSKGSAEPKNSEAVSEECSPEAKREASIQSQGEEDTCWSGGMGYGGMGYGGMGVWGYGGDDCATDHTCASPTGGLRPEVQPGVVLCVQ